MACCSSFQRLSASSRSRLSGRFAILVAACELPCLGGDVDADFFAPGGEELAVDGAGSAGCDWLAVLLDDGLQANRRAGEKDFGGGGEFRGEDVGFLMWNAKVIGKFKEELQADTGKDAVESRRNEAAVFVVGDDVGGRCF